jgi:hypothetical protein
VRWLRFLVVMGCFLGLACLSLYPLIFNPGGVIPGANILTDYYHFHWNYWWIRHALTHGLNVYETNFVLAPFTSSLALHTLTPFWYPLWALAEPLIGTISAMTLVFITALVLNGTVFYAFLRRWGVSSGWALAGGALFMLAPQIQIGVFWTNLNLLGWFWLPALMLVWDRVVSREEKKLLQSDHTLHTYPGMKDFTAKAQSTQRDQDFEPPRRHARHVFQSRHRGYTEDAERMLLQRGRATEQQRNLEQDFQSRSRGAEEQSNLSMQRNTFVWVVVLGLTVWAMVLTDVQYPLFAAFVVLPYALWTICQARSLGARLRLIGLGLAAGVIGLALLWLAGPLPYLLNYNRTGLSSTPVERAVEIPFPVDFMSYSRPYEQVALGTLPLLLVGLGLIVKVQGRFTAKAQRAQRLQDFETPSHREASLSRQERHGFQSSLSAWFWLGLAVPPVILAAGGFISVGETTLTLPYVWLHDLFGGQFRYPERFSMVFLIPALTFACMVLSAGRATRLLPPALLLLLIALDTRLYLPIPTRPAPPEYGFYRAMAQEAEEYVVVEVPTGGSSGEGIVGEREYSALQFYGTVHGKRMVNGHIARVNTWHYWWMRTDDAMMSWLGQRRLLEAETVTAQLRQRLTEWPIGYIVIHRDLIWRSGPTQQEIFGYFNQQDDLVCPAWVEGEAVVYRARWHPAGCPARTPAERAPGIYRLEIGVEDDVRYIGWGWHEPEVVAGLNLRWMGQYAQTDVYIDLPPGSYSLQASLQAFHEARRVRLLVNDQAVGKTVRVTPDNLSAYTFTIPAESIGDGRHIKISFSYDATITPESLGMGADTRPLAISADWLQFERID